jgi:indolepyruvate ferredoxin oxidoreductase beta subunit
VVEAAEVASLRFISFDMERIAVENGTMISASLLGALAGSGALPFTRESFEAAIKASGRGADASLAAFGAAYDRARGMASKEAVSIPPHPASAPLGHPLPAGERRSSTLVHIEAGLPPSLALSVQSSSPRRGEGGRAERRPGEGALRKEQQASTVTGPRSLVGAWETLVARVAAMPEAIRDMALRGVRKVVDYQDIAYGRDYLDLLDKAMALDDAAHGYRLSIAAAKHLANALCYDDMIRVADLKTRSARDARVRREVGVRGESILQVTEFFHPRVEEFCGTLPVRLGRYIEDRPKLAAWIDRRINRGRRIRTDSMTGFAMLWVIGGLRRWRRSLLRHAVEAAHIDRWYRLALDHAASDYDLAVEILACRRLIKGYSDTHARAQSKFDRVLSALPILKGRTDAAEWLRRLREAALKDEKGDMLDGALKTVRSFAQDGSATAGQE